jgi:prophage antirepressor-like protein
MNAEIIPFDFEEQAVRVVMRDGEPWFVAADVCRVLEIGNPTDAVRRLDDDEVTLDTIEGSHRQTNLINESGLYALVLTSRKDQAKRFRKWITAEVLPAIRRTGRYEHPASIEAQPAADIAGLSIREAEAWLSMVREARLTQGRRAGAAIWARSPLPQPIAAPTGRMVEVDGWACLRHLLGSEVGGQTVDFWTQTADEDAAEAALRDAGMRMTEAGLFVANGGFMPLARIFHGTDWAGGLHREALAQLPGIIRPATPRTLNGVGARGLVVSHDTLIACTGGSVHV